MTYKIRATYLPRPDMTFDMAYYLREHVALARRQTAGRVPIRRMDVEMGTALLMGSGPAQTPCVFSVYLDTLEDVETFRRFLQSDAVEPLRRDVAQYTDCDLEWTVCEVRDV